MTLVYSAQISKNKPFRDRKPIGFLNIKHIADIKANFTSNKLNSLSGYNTSLYKKKPSGFYEGVALQGKVRGTTPLKNPEGSVLAINLCGGSNRYENPEGCSSYLSTLFQVLRYEKPLHKQTLALALALSTFGIGRNVALRSFGRTQPKGGDKARTSARDTQNKFNLAKIFSPIYYYVSQKAFSFSAAPFLPLSTFGIGRNVALRYLQSQDPAGLSFGPVLLPSVGKEGDKNRTEKKNPPGFLAYATETNPPGFSKEENLALAPNPPGSTKGLSSSSRPSPSPLLGLAIGRDNKPSGFFVERSEVPYQIRSKTKATLRVISATTEGKGNPPGSTTEGKSNRIRRIGLHSFQRKPSGFYEGLVPYDVEQGTEGRDSQGTAAANKNYKTPNFEVQTLRVLRTAKIPSSAWNLSKKTNLQILKHQNLKNTYASSWFLNSPGFLEQSTESKAAKLMHISGYVFVRDEEKLGSEGTAKPFLCYWLLPFLGLVTYPLPITRGENSGDFLKTVLSPKPSVFSNFVSCIRTKSLPAPVYPFLYGNINKTLRVLRRDETAVSSHTKKNLVDIALSLSNLKNVEYPFLKNPPGFRYDSYLLPSEEETQGQGGENQKIRNQTAFMKQAKSLLLKNISLAKKNMYYIPQIKEASIQEVLPALSLGPSVRYENPEGFLAYPSVAFPNQKGKQADLSLSSKATENKELPKVSIGVPKKCNPFGKVETLSLTVGRDSPSFRIPTVSLPLESLPTVSLPLESLPAVVRDQFSPLLPKVSVGVPKQFTKISNLSFAILNRNIKIRSNFKWYWYKLLDFKPSGFFEGPNIFSYVSGCFNKLVALFQEQPQTKYKKIFLEKTYFPAYEKNINTVYFKIGNLKKPTNPPGSSCYALPLEVLPKVFGTNKFIKYNLLLPSFGIPTGEEQNSFAPNQLCFAFLASSFVEPGGFFVFGTKRSTSKPSGFYEGRVFVPKTKEQATEFRNPPGSSSTFGIGTVLCSSKPGGFPTEGNKQLFLPSVSVRLRTQSFGNPEGLEVLPKVEQQPRKKNIFAIGVTSIKKANFLKSIIQTNSSSEIKTVLKNKISCMPLPTVGEPGGFFKLGDSVLRINKPSGFSCVLEERFQSSRLLWNLSTVGRDNKTQELSGFFKGHPFISTSKNVNMSEALKKILCLVFTKKSNLNGAAKNSFKRTIKKGANNITEIPIYDSSVAGQNVYNYILKGLKDSLDQIINFKTKKNLVDQRSCYNERFLRKTYKKISVLEGLWENPFIIAKKDTDNSFFKQKKLLSFSKPMLISLVNTKNNKPYNKKGLICLEQSSLPLLCFRLLWYKTQERDSNYLLSSSPSSCFPCVLYKRLQSKKNPKGFLRKEAMNPEGYPLKNPEGSVLAIHLCGGSNRYEKKPSGFPKDCVRSRTEALRLPSDLEVLPKVFVLRSKKQARTKVLHLYKRLQSKKPFNFIGLYKEAAIINCFTYMKKINRYSKNPEGFSNFDLNTQPIRILNNYKTVIKGACSPFQNSVFSPIKKSNCRASTKQHASDLVFFVPKTKQTKQSEARATEAKGNPLKNPSKNPEGEGSGSLRISSDCIARRDPLKNPSKNPEGYLLPSFGIPKVVRYRRDVVGTQAEITRRGRVRLRNSKNTFGRKSDSFFKEGQRLLPTVVRSEEPGGFIIPQTDSLFGSVAFVPKQRKPGGFKFKLKSRLRSQALQFGNSSEDFVCFHRNSKKQFNLQLTYSPQKKKEYVSSFGEPGGKNPEGFAHKNVNTQSSWNKAKISAIIRPYKKEKFLPLLPSTYGIDQKTTFLRFLAFVCGSKNTVGILAIPEEANESLPKQSNQFIKAAPLLRFVSPKVLFHKKHTKRSNEPGGLFNKEENKLHSLSLFVPTKLVAEQKNLFLSLSKYVQAWGQIGCVATESQEPSGFFKGVGFLNRIALSFGSFSYRKQTALESLKQNARKPKGFPTTEGKGRNSNKQAKFCPEGKRSTVVRGKRKGRELALQVFGTKKEENKSAFLKPCETGRLLIIAQQLYLKHLLSPYKQHLTYFPEYAKGITVPKDGFNSKISSSCYSVGSNRLLWSLFGTVLPKEKPEGLNKTQSFGNPEGLKKGQVLTIKKNKFEKIFLSYLSKSKLSNSYPFEKPGGSLASLATYRRNKKPSGFSEQPKLLTKQLKRKMKLTLFNNDLYNKDRFICAPLFVPKTKTFGIRTENPPGFLAYPSVALPNQKGKQADLFSFALRDTQRKQIPSVSVAFVPKQRKATDCLLSLESLKQIPTVVCFRSERDSKEPEGFPTEGRNSKKEEENPEGLVFLLPQTKSQEGEEAKVYFSNKKIWPFNRSLQFQYSPSILLRNRLFLKEINKIQHKVDNSFFASSKITSPKTLRVLRSTSVILNARLYRKQHNKIKRRLKKMKKETRRRKKRKIFFPRPTWITFSMYKNFLSLRSSLYGLYSNNGLQSKPYKLVWLYNIAPLKIGAVGSLRRKPSGFSFASSTVGRIARKEITNPPGSSKYGFRVREEKVAIATYGRDTQSEENPPGFSKGEGHNQDFYRISKTVFGDLKRILMKSNWLRNYLNPYLDKVKNIYKEMKRQFNEAEIYINLKSFILFIYFHTKISHIYSLPTLALLLAIPSYRIPSVEEANETQATPFSPSVLFRTENKLLAPLPTVGKDTQENPEGLFQEPHTILKKPSGFYEAAMLNNKRQKSINLLEYNRLIYQRIQRIILNIRENLNLNGQIKNRSKKLGKNIRTFIKREYALKSNTADTNTNSDNMVWSTIIRNNFLKLSRSFITNSLRLSTNEPYNNIAQLSSRNNFYWALNKSSMYTNLSFNTSDVKKLWETYKIKEMSKSNKTKKIMFNIYTTLNKFSKPTNSLDGYINILECKRSKNYKSELLYFGCVRKKNPEGLFSCYSGGSKRFFLLAPTVGIGFASTWNKPSGFCYATEVPQEKEEHSTELSILTSIPVKTYTMKSEQKLINVENKLKLLGLYVRKNRQFCWKNIASPFFRFSFAPVREEISSAPVAWNLFRLLRKENKTDCSAPCPLRGRDFLRILGVSFGCYAKKTNTYGSWNTKRSKQEEPGGFPTELPSVEIRNEPGGFVISTYGSLYSERKEIPTTEAREGIKNKKNYTPLFSTSASITKMSNNNNYWWSFLNSKNHILLNSRTFNNLQSRNNLLQRTYDFNSSGLFFPPGLLEQSTWNKVPNQFRSAPLYRLDLKATNPPGSLAYPSVAFPNQKGKQADLLEQIPSVSVAFVPKQRKATDCFLSLPTIEEPEVFPTEGRNSKKQQTPFNRVDTSILSSLLFHFCTLISFISLGGVRTLIKFYYILISKILKLISNVHKFSLLPKKIFIKKEAPHFEKGGYVAHEFSFLKSSQLLHLGKDNNGSNNNNNNNNSNDKGRIKNSDVPLKKVWPSLFYIAPQKLKLSFLKFLTIKRQSKAQLSWFRSLNLRGFVSSSSPPLVLCPKNEGNPPGSTKGSSYFVFGTPTETSTGSSNGFRKETPKVLSHKKQETSLPLKNPEGSVRLRTQENPEGFLFSVRKEVLPNPPGSTKEEEIRNKGEGINNRKQRLYKKTYLKKLKKNIRFLKSKQKSPTVISFFDKAGGLPSFLRFCFRSERDSKERTPFFLLRNRFGPLLPSVEKSLASFLFGMKSETKYFDSVALESQNARKQRKRTPLLKGPFLASNKNPPPPGFATQPKGSTNKNHINLVYCFYYINIGKASLYTLLQRWCFYTFLLILKSLDVLAIPASFIYKFFEKPGEYVVEILAYSFLVEWSADLISTIPETMDTSQVLFFSKIQRSSTSLIFINSLAYPTLWTYSNLLKNPPGFLAYAADCFHRNSKKQSLDVFNISQSFFFSISHSIFKRLFTTQFALLIQQLCEPDLDYIKRQKKGIVFWDVWGESLKTVAEDYSINIYELTTDKEEQIKLLTKYEETLFQPLLKSPPGSLRISSDCKKEPILAKNQELRKNKNYYGWSVSQFLSYQGKDTDLFLDLHPPKTFSSSASPNLIKGIKDINVQQPIGSIVCQIFAGIFYKQISKNILVVSGAIGLEKSLLIQAIAGETELKIITDNAHRYAMVFRGVAVGIKLLRDVFEALAVHTPCIFLMEDIHAIGERRPFLIDASTVGDTISSESTYNKNQSMQGLFLKEKNSAGREVLYKNTKHLLSHYKKPYKEPRNLATNHYSFTFLFGNKTKVRNVEKPYGRSALSVQVIKKEKEAKYKNIFTNSNKEEKTFFNKRAAESSLLIKPSNDEILSPPASSPFSILILKEATKLKHKKVVKEMPWFGLPGEQFSLVSKYNYSIRVKVALLADLVLSNLSVKLDMITDLLVIIDSVKGNRGFVVFATTHLPYILDPALRRPGRFDETISLPLIPSLYSRWANYRYNLAYAKTSLFRKYNIPLNSNLNKGITIDLTKSNFQLGHSPETQDNSFEESGGFGVSSYITAGLANYISIGSSSINKRISSYLAKKPSPSGFCYATEGFYEQKSSPTANGCSATLVPNLSLFKSTFFLNKRTASVPLTLTYSLSLRKLNKAASSPLYKNNNNYYNNNNNKESNPPGSSERTTVGNPPGSSTEGKGQLRTSPCSWLIPTPSDSVAFSYRKQNARRRKSTVEGLLPSEPVETSSDQKNRSKGSVFALTKKPSGFPKDCVCIARTEGLCATNKKEKNAYNKKIINKQSLLLKSRNYSSACQSLISLILFNSVSDSAGPLIKGIAYFQRKKSIPSVALASSSFASLPTVVCFRYEKEPGGLPTVVCLRDSKEPGGSPTTEGIGFASTEGIARTKVFVFGCTKAKKRTSGGAKARARAFLNNKQNIFIKTKTGFVKKSILKWPNIFKYTNYASLINEASIYLSFFGYPLMLKIILMSLIGGKLGRSFAISKQSMKGLAPLETTQLNYDKTWKYASSLLFSYIQKHQSTELKKHLAFCSTKLLSFNNKNSLMEAPSPPISNVLLPAKRNENYKRTFNNNLAYAGQLNSNYNNFNVYGINNRDIIELHQHQRLLKRLSKYPIKEFFRSHSLGTNPLKNPEGSGSLLWYNRKQTTVGICDSKRGLNKNETSELSFNNSYLVLGPLEKTKLASINKLSSVHSCYKNLIYNRHRTYLTNQWWNGQQGEHNAESTFLSDIDWRYTFVQSIGDVYIDFPDSEQYYNPRNRRWFLTKGDWNFWFNIQAELKDIYSHYVYECFSKAYKYLDQNREIIDFYAELLQQAPLASDFKEKDLLNLYKRFHATSLLLK